MSTRPYDVPGEWSPSSWGQHNLGLPGHFDQVILASWWLRALGFVLDLILPMYLTIALKLPAWVLLVYVVANSCILQGMSGQSWAKALLGIQVATRTSDDYGATQDFAYPGIARCLVRTWLHQLDIFTIYGCFRPAFERYRRSFADSLTSTVVVVARSVDLKSPWSSDGR